MKNNRLSIGQMAELNHTTLATLRLYDENGLLKPVNVDPTNGYRIYDVLQSTAFHIIQYNKELSLSLKEIKEVLDRSDFDFLSATYQRKLVDLDKELKEILWKKTEIEKILLWMDYFRHLPPAGTFTMEYIPKSYVYAEPAARDYFQEDFGSVVYDLSHMEGALRQKGVRGIYPYDAFLSMKLDDFEAGHYRTEQLGVNLPKEAVAKLHAEVWPSNMSACVYLDDFTQAADYLDQLRAYCEKQHCTPTGDVTCQIIGVIDKQDFRKTSEILRLQVPVEPGKKTHQ